MKNHRKTSRTEAKSLSLKIARIQREKTTRRRRLKDRERTHVQETIIQSVLNLVQAQMTRPISGETLCQKVLLACKEACDTAETGVPGSLKGTYTTVK